ncbi:MAG: EF-hand domain-containing protein [Candidatus Thalassarchaeum sp.]|nr:EF-hand domain-containing protein [Candidatus Thalassarchaeum sp.]
MTRAYALLASILLMATPLAGCTSSPEIEEIVDDILGCMDENAENYDDNATAELLGDCIYLASMEVFMTAMTEQMEIDEMLEIIPQAGYSMSITASEFNVDMGMQMDTVIEEMVMADLDTDSVYVKNGMSMAPLMTFEYTHIQVGELVNVHYTLGGMFAGEGAGMGSYQTRDADPDVMEIISSMVQASDSDGLGEIGLALPTGDLSEMSSDMPADAEPVISYDDESGVQTMTLEYTNDSGHDISIVTLIDDSEDLMSYEISTDNGSATTSISYTVMWGDAVIIEVDDTLPRTSIPINFHVEGMPEDDGGDDMFYCDNGNEISRDLVDDGWDDCGDGSDESDDGDDDDRDPEQMMDYMDTDDDGYLSLQELIDFLNNDREQNGEEPMSSEEEEGTANWFYSGDTDGDDLLSLDEFTQLLESTGDDDGGDDIDWMDYYDGYCEWEGDVDGDEDVWYCKYSEDQEYWDTWWYYCEDHEDDGWHCTDDFGQSEDFEYSSGGDEWSGSDDDDEGDEMFTCDNGDEIPMDWVNDGWDDCGDGSDEYEDGDESDDEEGDVEPFRVTMMVMGQTLNAPISDFEVRFLFDCREPEDEEDDIPPSDCSIAASNGLTEGSATVDPTLTEYEFTYEYLDYDGDGLISDMDTLVIDNLWPDVRVELYDTWADQYTSESFATAEMLPGFGALMALTVLLGAAFATRRD